MKVLVLTPQLPAQPHKGTTMRNHYLLKHLAQRHAVHLLSFIDRETSEEEVRSLRQWCRAVTTVPVETRRRGQRLAAALFSSLPDMALRLHSRIFAGALGKLLREEPFDLVQVEGIELAPYLLRWKGAGPGARGEGPRFVLDEHNCEYRLQQLACAADLRRLRLGGGLYSLLQWRRLRRYEAEACRAADAVVAVSEADGQGLTALDPRLKVTVVPNGIDVAYYHPVYAAKDRPDAPSDSPPTLIFAGTMDFRPNVDAAAWMAREIMPRIWQEAAARLLLLGRSPNPAVRRLEGERVVVSGTVADVRPYLLQARVYVVPLRMGGGTRFKVLEGMAAGVPVVSTRVGGQGIPLEAGRHALLADDAPSFARAVLELLRHPQRARALAREAHRWVSQEYDWGVILPRLDALYAELAEARVAP